MTQFLVPKVAIVLAILNLLNFKATAKKIKLNIEGLIDTSFEVPSNSQKYNRKMQNLDVGVETEKVTNLALEYEMFGNYKDVQGYSEKYYSEIANFQSYPFYGKKWNSIGPTTSSNPQTRHSGRLRSVKT